MPETQQRPLSRSPLHYLCHFWRGGGQGSFYWLDKALIRRSKMVTSVKFQLMQTAVFLMVRCDWSHLFSPWDVVNTCTHYVIPQEWYHEKSCQYHQAGSHTRKRLSKTTAFCAEAGKGSSTHDTMRMTTQNVVLVWRQFGRLHQLSKEIDERGDWSVNLCCKH